MTATCQLCGVLLTADLTISQRMQIAAASQNEEERLALIQVNEFDLIAARAAAHIAERHQEQARMSMMVVFAAGKVYAATHLESSTEPAFNRLRTSWRKSLLRDVGFYRDEDEAPAAAAPPAPAAEPLGAGEAT